jgi:acetylglutamate kinase
MRLHVIKIGGNIIDDPIVLNTFLAKLKDIAEPLILIHGGGKIATKTAEKLGVQTNMIEGRRVTSGAMRDVVMMVYGGLINKNIVAQLQAIGVNAIGLSGADAKVLEAVKRPTEPIDYGFVGDVKKVNSVFLKTLLEAGLCPILAPLSYDPVHGVLNTNADTIASAVATSLSTHFEVSLYFCFEKKGVLRDLADENSIIKDINSQNFDSLKKQGIIYEGMIPKIQNALKAVKEGVESVYICQEADLIEITQGASLGTKIS